MNIPKAAIEKAIAGGWHFGEEPSVTQNNDGLWVEFLAGNDTRTLHESDIALDATFWQCLGKTLGWEHEHMRVNWGREEIYSVSLWQFYAVKFYDLILTGQPIDEFWKELLSDSLE